MKNKGETSKTCKVWWITSVRFLIYNYLIIVAVGTYFCAKSPNGTYYVPKCQNGTYPAHIFVLGTYFFNIIFIGDSTLQHWIAWVSCYIIYCGQLFERKRQFWLKEKAFFLKEKAFFSKRKGSFYWRKRHFFAKRKGNCR